MQKRDGLLCDGCYVDFGFECLGFRNKIVFDKAGRRIRVGDRMVVYVHSKNEAFQNCEVRLGTLGDESETRTRVRVMPNLGLTWAALSEKARGRRRTGS